MRSLPHALPLALAAPLAPTPAAAAALEASDTARAAQALAELVHPLELAVATATEGSDRYFVASMIKNADVAALEKEYPGITEAMYRSARPFLIEAERRNAAKTQEMLAALYVRELNAADIATLQTFFTSPTGHKVIREMFNPIAVKHTAEAIAADPEADIKAETLIVGQAQAVGRMVAALTADDEKVAAALLETPAGKKWHALTPKVQAMSVELVNTDHPDIQAKVDAAMQTAADRFMAAADD